MRPRKYKQLTIPQAAYLLVHGSRCFDLKDKLPDMNINYTDENLEIRIVWLDQVFITVQFLPDYVIATDFKHSKHHMNFSYNSPDLEQDLHEFLVSCLTRSMRFQFRNFLAVAIVVGVVTALLWFGRSDAGRSILNWF